MKKTLFFLVLSLLLSLSSFAQSGWQKVQRQNSSNGQIQRGWVRRDLAVYPNTTAGNTAFYTAVNNGSLTIVLTDPLATTPPSSTTTTPTSPTLSAGSLAFNIVAYNCSSGVLQYKLTSNSASSITVSMPGVFAGALSPGSVQNYTFPSDAKVGRTITGTAAQNGNQIAINFVTSCTLGPTTTDPPSSTVTNPPSSTYVAPIPVNYDWTPIASTYVAPGDSTFTIETPYQKAIIALARRWGDNGGNSITGPRLSGMVYKHYVKGETFPDGSGFSYPPYAHYSVTDLGQGSPASDGLNFTLGTQYGIGSCIYMEPIPNVVASQTGQGTPDANTTGLGRNPVQGDDRGNTSLVLQFGYRPDLKRYYLKSVPPLYNAYGALAKGTIFEEWHDFYDNIHDVHSRITTDYTRTGFNDGYDKQEHLYDGEQEMPSKYINAATGPDGGRKNLVSFYNGNNPCGSDMPTVINVNTRTDHNGQPIYTGMRTAPYWVTEPWIFVSGTGGENAKGTGLILTVSKTKVANFGSGDDQSDRVSPNSNVTYISEKPDVQFENQGVVYYRWREYHGTRAGIRAEACKTENRFASKPNYRFNTADKQNWKISAFGDPPVLTTPPSPPEKRTEDKGAADIAAKGYWDLTFNRSGNSQFGTYGVSFKASECTKIYVNMAYTGPSTYWGFSWLRNGQAPDNAPRDSEEGQVFFKGLASNGQGTNFPVIGDGQRRTYVIDVSNHSLWNPGGSEYIHEIKFTPHPSGMINGTDHANLYWISTDPNGPPN